MIDARDGVRDKSIQCGRGKPPKPGKGQKGGQGSEAGKRAAIASGARRAGSKPTSLAFTDSFDPTPTRCDEVKFGHPVPGLNG